MVNSVTFVALKNNTTVKVVPTKFDRSIGDMMNIEGINFSVIHIGTRNECVRFINETIINPMNEITKRENAKIRKGVKLSEFDRAVLEAIKKYSL